MRLFQVALCLFVSAVLSVPSTAQVATGIYDSGTFESLPGGTINVGNLNINLSVPVINKPGRAGTNFSYALAFDSAVWQPLNVSGTTTWQPSATWGWSAQTQPVLGSLTYALHNQTCFDADLDEYHSYQTMWHFKYLDNFGRTHSFPTALYIPPVDGCDSVTERDNVGTASDGSGMTVDPLAATVTYRNGSVVDPPVNIPSGDGGYTDTNGNTISISGSSFTDTLGMTALSVSGGAPSNLVYTYSDIGGSPQYVTVSYVSYTVQTAFGCSGVSEYGPLSSSLVDRITFADGTYYGFTYEATPGVSGNVTGRIGSVHLPTGGTVSYTYSGTNNGINCSDGSTMTLTRTTSDGSQTYTRSSITSTSSITDETSGSSDHTIYNFVLASTVNNQVYLTHKKAYTGSATGTPLREDQICYNGVTSSCDTTVPTFPLSYVSINATLNGSVSNGTDIEYDTSGQISNVVQYDYANGSTHGPALLSTYYGMNGTTGVPLVVTVSDSSNRTVSKHTYNYDETTPSSTSGLPSHTSASGARLNLTSESLSDSAGTLTEAYYTYDDAGSLLSARQDTSDTTTVTYDSGTDTFPVQINFPSTTTGGTTTTHYVQQAFDSNTGLQTSFTDQNHSGTTTYTYDAMLRPNTITSPDTGVTTMTYTPTGSTPNVATSILHAGSTSITSTVYYDGYGRLLKTDSQDSSDDLVDYAYTSNGLLYSTSNPYRSGSTPVYTTNTYDALGRMTGITEPDSSTKSFIFSGNTVTLQDEVSHQREQVFDGVGRLVKLLEPDSTGSLTLETDYAYYQNTAASAPYTYQNIIQQKGGSTSSSLWHTRTFTYDLLGRLVSKNEPESGTTSYSYLSGTSACSGSPGQVCSRTDANGTVTSYAYDAMNRLTGKSYSGSSIASATASVTYSYDQSSYNGLTIAYGVGLRTGMTDGSGATAWSFDIMGRPVATRKTLNSVTKQAGYTYNLDGTVNTLTDFGGTTLTYSYDSAGRQTGVLDGAGNSYASSATYNAASQLTGMTNQLTSGSTDYTRSISYNSRQQPYTIQAAASGTTIQSLTYAYGSSGSNNGNISGIVNGMDSTHHRDQSYTYDNLNRLSQGSDGTHWGQSYTYDNWGNLYQTSQLSGLGGLNWSLTAPGNSNQLSNMAYDSAGQVTEDQFSNMYAYDAEGRILSGGSGTYIYDGDGYRVSKTASSTTTLYWPTAVAGISDESNSSGASFAKEVYVAGVKVWSESNSGSGVFLFHDHLGSTRITATSSGTLQDDIDYLPYGYKFSNYGTASSNHYQFTGDESDDTESSTEYATFRNLSPSMGRFHRPDPFDGSYDLTNSQSLNRYSYVLNSPLIYGDPTGTKCVNGFDHEDPCVDPVSPDPNPDPCANNWEDCGGGGGSGGYGGSPGGGGGGTIAPNNFCSVLSSKKCKSNKPSCLAVFARGLFQAGEDTFGPVTDAAGAVSQVVQNGLEIASNYYGIKAGTYSATAINTLGTVGLLVPLRSSIYRGLLATSADLGEISAYAWGGLLIYNLVKLDVQAIRHPTPCKLP